MVVVMVMYSCVYRPCIALYISVEVCIVVLECNYNAIIM